MYSSPTNFSQQKTYRFISVFLLFIVGLLPGLLFSQTIDTLWNENWEGNWDVDWHVDGGTWEVGVPTSGPNSAYTGQKCAATVLDGNYDDWVNSRLIRHTSFIVPSNNPRLRFWHWYSFNSGDYGKVQISTDGVNWSDILTSYTNSSSNVWSYTYIDLSAYTDSTVQIAFFFHSEDVWPSGWEVGPGWYIDDVILIYGDVTYNKPEDFESGIGDWSAERGTWEIGEPTSGPGSAYSGLICAATVLDGDYHDWVNSRLVSPPLVVPSNNPRLRFWQWFSFSSGDYGVVQISTDGVNWTNISSTYNNTSSNVWSYTSIDLSAYADSTIQFAFFFHSEDVWPSGWEIGPGWYIDDVAIITGPFVFSNPEDFESGIGDWAAERGTWEVGELGEPTVGPDSAHSPPNCAGTVLDGNYHDGVNSRFISPPGVVQSGGFLQFWHWYSFSSGDYGEVHIKVNDGPWQTISSRPFTGTSSNAWTPYYISLSTYVDSTVQIGFFFHSEDVWPSGWEVGPGWYIDDIILPFPPNSINEGEVTIITEFSLQQNYPNPFNPITNIKYSLPKGCLVNLEIYNILGQKVATVVGGKQRAGYKVARWDASLFASGIYFYRIHAGDFVETRKMVLIR